MERKKSESMAAGIWSSLCNKRSNSNRPRKCCAIQRLLYLTPKHWGKNIFDTSITEWDRRQKDSTNLLASIYLLHLKSIGIEPLYDFSLARSSISSWKLRNYAQQPTKSKSNLRGSIGFHSGLSIEDSLDLEIWTSEMRENVREKIVCLPLRLTSLVI